VAALYQRNDRFVRTSFENGNRRLRGIGSLISMSNPVYRGDQNPTLVTADKVMVAALALAR
jgi:hypothetical protein